MKKQTISFKVEMPKHRQHYVLFCEDTPFKPKAVKPKTLYKRKPKYIKNDQDWQ